MRELYQKLGGMRSLLVLFVIFYLLFKVTPLFNNNFFFTMDQADDSVHMRNMVSNSVFYLYGPSTGIRGVFTGPLWYYFLLPGYLLFNGHPFGHVFMLLILNLGLSLWLYGEIRKLLNPYKSLLIIFSLQFLWDFYDTSRYSFNPFPAVFLTFLMIFSLVKVILGEKRYIYLAAVATGFCYHFEISYAIPLTLLMFGTGLYLLKNKLLNLGTGVKAFLIFLSFYIFHFIRELQNNFSQIRSLINYLIDKYPTPKNIPQIIYNILIDIPGKTIFPLVPIIGFVLYLGLTIYFLLKINKKEVKIFVILSNLLLLINLVWFLFGPEWQTWHVIFLPILLFVGVLLMIFCLSKKVSIVLFVFVMTSQLLVFIPRYIQYFRLSDDPSLLANEIKAVEWVYEKAEGQGFSVYNYLPSVLDYPYQYLFWWHGLRKYGYLPCEYASYPGSPGIFIPNKKKFVEPKKCGDLHFLIIEPNKKNPQLRENWINDLKQGYELIEESFSGKILIQKYLPNN
jgi:hypothetical protein